MQEAAGTNRYGLIPAETGTHAERAIVTMATKVHGITSKQASFPRSFRMNLSQQDRQSLLTQKYECSARLMILWKKTMIEDVLVVSV
jgi:hypothetical protein